MNPLFASIMFHAIGAFSAAICYVPQKSAKRWSWQTFWLTQAAFCWFILPIVGAFLTVPDYSSVLHEISGTHEGRMVMLRTFLLGMAYGVGGTAFGVAIRYVGFSITYAMAIGISMVFGTAYAIAKGGTSIADSAAHFQEFAAKVGSTWVMGGMGIGVIGIVFCGMAGRWKENDHAQPGANLSSRNKAVVGILLCIAAGLLSAVYNMALTEGAPIANMANFKSRFDVSNIEMVGEIAPTHSLSDLANLVAPANLAKADDVAKLTKQGVNVEKLMEIAKSHQVMGIDAATFSSNATYPFSNAGAFLTTALYCLLLHRKHKTLGEVVNLPEGGEKASLSMNWVMAILTGCLWYGQFFFYGFGHYYITKVEGFEQTCWAIHMILLILLGTLVGIVCKEWKNCRSRTYMALAAALALLIAGKLSLDYGNYLGQQAAEKSAQAQAESVHENH